MIGLDRLKVKLMASNKGQDMQDRQCRQDMQDTHAII
jgi:hypothetical protein